MPTYNKVELDGTTLLDLSQDTVSSASHIRQGYVGHLNDGSTVTGTYSGSSPTIQSLTVTPSTSQQSFNASNVDGYKPVTVNAIPSQYIVPSGNLAITQNGTGIDVSQYATVSVNVPSGSSNFTLLGTQSVGTVSTTSTTASDTGVTITVKGVYAYDLLVCECSVDSTTNNRHTATTRLCWLTASSNVSTKDGGTFATATWNSRLSSQGVTTTRSNTTAYGVYANGITLSAGSTGDNGQAVITIYRRYNNTQTGTINGSYTMRVYGVKIYDLIGG